MLPAMAKKNPEKQSERQHMGKYTQENHHRCLEGSESGRSKLRILNTSESGGTAFLGVRQKKGRENSTERKKRVGEGMLPKTYEADGRERARKAAARE